VTSITEDPPWLALPAEITEVLRPHLASVVDQIIDTIPRDVPSYARPIEGTFGAGLRRGVQVALDRFLDLPGTRNPALAPASRQVYVALGGGEVRQGRSLESLLAAYRSGARVTFRALSGIAESQGLPTQVLIPLGESIFAYIEELSAASVEGYAMEQSEQVGERERRRADVLTLLIRGKADEASLRHAASAAGWGLPEELVAITVPLARAEGLRLALGPEALVMARADDAVAILAAPATARARGALERALQGRGAVIGPARSWQTVPDSLRMAGLAGALPVRADDGTSSGSARPVWVSEHLAEVAIGSAHQVIADLAQTRLAPLAELRLAQRERLVETLIAWLRHRGQRKPVAQELGVHPQTVAYRVGQLRDLFGDDLDDPEARFELELVLRGGHR
jgi:PucR C-terminal helix-turn-helix domain